ncbi:MAG: 16S rRNA (cytidine(1402)-2'-O)-methyltransferase [Elusimicrobia bacterium]|nr:16S rRNA (cytidine(1402)-2'-O)-methyltransferase [Elusimicrobiota bacterium]
MLYLVATPIGNLEDLTYRAVRVLKDCDAVFCEDTRRTRKLLAHLDIHKPLLRYVEGRTRSAEGVFHLLAQGRPVALVSDGGTPTVSDPGARLVSEARRRGYPVTVVPGACAAVIALAGSGLPTDGFVFLGFLPRRSQRRRRELQKAGELGKSVVVYESPYRVRQLLEDAVAVWGGGVRTAVARELTKLHEQWLSGTAEELLGSLEPSQNFRGEVTVLFFPLKEP